MLYIVATPIGNLDDLSIRAARTIVSSDFILAEDTRSAYILQDAITDRFQLKPKQNQRVLSYYRQKEFEKLPQILSWLEEGKTISLISESGMPVISDPGHLLIETVLKRGLKMEVIPGPSAYVTALAYSGFEITNSLFLGFLPKKESEIRKALNKFIEFKKIEPETVFVFYESSMRINKTLQTISEMIPDANLVICREITKKFEEIIRGRPKDLLKRSYKGEITVVLK